VIHNLAKLGLHALGRQAYGVVQQLTETRAVKRGHAEFVRAAASTTFFDFSLMTGSSMAREAMPTLAWTK